MYWSEVGNMLSWKIHYYDHKWLVHFESSSIHALLKNGRLQKLLNDYKRNNEYIFNGKKEIHFLQGVKMTPKIEDRIEPFMIYATNSYGLNKSNSTDHRQASRFDVVEVHDENNMSTYRLVLAILSVRIRGSYFLRMLLLHS
jgi:hypothetical protein